MRQLSQDYNSSHGSVFAVRPSPAKPFVGSSELLRYSGHTPRKWGSERWHLMPRVPLWVWTQVGMPGSSPWCYTEGCVPSAIDSDQSREPSRLPDSKAVVAVPQGDIRCMGLWCSQLRLLLSELSYVGLHHALGPTRTGRTGEQGP